MTTTAPEVLPPVINKNVQRSARMLDQVMPDWHTRLNLDTLDLYSTDKCVLGQLYGSYLHGLDALSAYDFFPSCCEGGFCTASASPEDWALAVAVRS